MNYVYHGSREVGLSIIKRNKGTYQQNWVHAAITKPAALVFINYGSGDLSYFISGIGTKDNPIILVERRPDTFKNIYNLSGSIYSLSDTNFYSNKTLWSGELVSERDEGIISEEYIANIWQEIKDMASRDEIKIYFYPDRPDNIPLDNSDLINRVIGYAEEDFTAMFLYMYPELHDRYYQALEESKLNGSNVL